MTIVLELLLICLAVAGGMILLMALPAPGDFCMEVPYDPARFACPTCGWVSYNLNDVRERYCGHCHTFADDTGHHHATAARQQPPDDLIEHS